MTGEARAEFKKDFPKWMTSQSPETTNQHAAAAIKRETKAELKAMRGAAMHPLAKQQRTAGAAAAAATTSAREMPAAEPPDIPANVADPALHKWGAMIAADVNGAE